MDLSYLAEMTISEETQFLTVFEQQLEHDVGEAARACLLRGVPIYYAEKIRQKDVSLKSIPMVARAPLTRITNALPSLVILPDIRHSVESDGSAGSEGVSGAGFDSFLFSLHSQRIIYWASQYSSYYQA